MQLMTFNSLLMFDIVFVFFLFLVGVTCLVYYLPPANRKSPQASPAQLYSPVETASQRISEDFTGCVRETNLHCYTQPFNRCPHHQGYYLHTHNRMQRKQEAEYQHSTTNPYLPIMTSKSSQNSRGVSDKDPVNKTIPSDQEQHMIKSHESSRHLYHNILNSAFEIEDELNEGDECSMIATNVQIVRRPAPVGLISTSPNNNQIENNEQANKESSSETVINIESQLPIAGNLGVEPSQRYPNPYQHRLECQSGRHVVGICQYHMQQHLKNHHLQHHLHRLQQEMMQEFAEEQQQHQGASNAMVRPCPVLPKRGEASPIEVINGRSADNHNKVQYIVVDTTTDRNNKRLNKYCHVKVQNCDIKKSVGLVDQV